MKFSVGRRFPFEEIPGTTLPINTVKIGVTKDHT